MCALMLMALSQPIAASLQAQGSCASGLRVESVEFAGSPSFDSDTLLATIATRTPSFWNRVLHIGSAPCADSVEIQRDALRIAVLHRQAGWFIAEVTARVNERDGEAKILFDVNPGPVAILDSLRITGLPTVAEAGRSFDRGLKALEGERFDRNRILVEIDRVLAALHNAGYARAVRGNNQIAIDTASAKVAMDLAFEPGNPVTIGNVDIEVQGIGDDAASIDSAGVLRLLGLRSGQLYRASAILDAQRALYRSEAFRFVVIDTQTPVAGKSDSTIDIHVSVAEAKTRYARAGLGWATQDCIRVQGRLTDRGFLGVGRRAELNLRASKIGRGAPADFAPGLCSNSVKTDTVTSFKLNYFAGLSLSDTRLFGTNIIPVFTIYSERRSEPRTYLRETDIGTVLELTRQLSRRTIGAAGFQYENGRTITDPVVSCSRFGQCRPEDFALSRFGRGVGLVSSSVLYDRTTDPINPRNGLRGRLEGRAGQTFSEIVSSLRFYRATVEGTVYRPLAGGVLATRLQYSQAFAPGAQLVDGSPLLPQQERLYAGGQNSVRGFQQNLLGPVIYVVSEVDTVIRSTGEHVIEVQEGTLPTRVVPRGGTALLVANLEYRHKIPFVSDNVQLALFVDAGNVWETNTDRFRAEDIRATPGFGIRLGTPLGPFRLDVGYQPYPPRAGRALFFTPGADGGIFCASPGNKVDYRGIGGSNIFDCPGSYRPARANGALSRLVFHFGLGQAF